MLTDTQIRKAAPADRPYKLTDGGGLYILVTPAGNKVWRYKYRFGGKEKLLTIGRYPKYSLASARGERDKARSTLDDGKDPGVEKKNGIAAAKIAAGFTFEKVAREWHAKVKGTWSQDHADDVMRSLERDVFPEIGDDPIASLKAPRILEVLRKIEARPAVETAHRIRQRISAVFVYGIASGICEDDPAATLGAALSKVVRGKQPAVTDLEKAREMLRAAEAIPAHPVTKLGNRLLALSVLRPGALLGTPWTELNAIKDDLWRVPPERMKLSVERKEGEEYEHWVPLTPQMIEVIDALRRLTGRCPFVLPGARHAHKHMSENAIGSYLNRAGYYGRHVAHGWRSTFSTVMNERFPADEAVIEVMLAHAPKDKVKAAYNRAKYIDRRRELARIWADLLMADMPPASALLNGRRR